MNHQTPMLNRLVFLTLAFVLLVGVSTQAAAQALLDAATHPKFVNPLPIPGRLDVTNGGKYDMEMREVVQSLGLVAPDNTPLMTTVWGYGQPDDVVGGFAPSYPAATIVAYSGVPVDFKWKNKLPKYNFPGGPGAHLLPVDPTLHMAHPVKVGIPTVTHLHGGHTESASDGLPEAWFTQGYKERGPFFVKKTYHYDNDQEAATLWYHDHALGITRLNVYAGLAGFYLLRDDNETQLTNSGVLPGGPYEVEIVIQDRMFDANGQLFFPSTGAEIEPGFDPLPPGPSIIAEFFGDFILVNGAAWPKFEVEPRKYRLRLLNGSDSRFYVLEFQDAEMGGTAQPFHQIGTDNGLLATPVELTRLLLAPGERADLVVDFSTQTEITLRNFGPDDPFKGFNPDGTISDGEGGVAPAADPATTGKIMKFVVNQPFNNGVPEATVGLGTVLRDDIAALEQNGATRNLVLFEGLDNFGRLQPLLGTLTDGSLTWFQPITENPMLDDVEVWEVYNATEDAHPIHLHLVSFQIISRESFTGIVEEKEQPQHDGSTGVGGLLTEVVLGGDARGPEPNEEGWKDTAVMLPGEVTRLIAKFDRPGRYVWHCHILSHEDHEMMRPYYVGMMLLAKGGASVTSGDRVDAPVSNGNIPSAVVLNQNEPNPFNPITQIRFALPVSGPVELSVYNVAGQLVQTMASGEYGQGEHVLTWDGRDAFGNAVSSGVYFYRLSAGASTHIKKMVLMR
ncbi:MAG: multicopper oxidase domain-containing protein [Candidatus Latescibacteria bacterium]|nr:multicopper oxidase domain-containing protein [Candidatus Latescibacterota bacterium]NIO56210.1 multicopper oxidase domain-containing protein [Candidatus Latescibacterota bacterium]